MSAWLCIHRERREQFQSIVSLHGLLPPAQDVVPDAKAEGDMDTDEPTVVEALKYDNLDQVSKLVQTERYQKILKVGSRWPVVQRVSQTDVCEHQSSIGAVNEFDFHKDTHGFCSQSSPPLDSAVRMLTQDLQRQTQPTRAQEASRTTLTTRHGLHSVDRSLLVGGRRCSQ